MGAYTEIVDFTFTANETSRTFSGLSITKDDFIKIVWTHVRGGSSESLIRLLANSSVNTDYTRQSLAAIGTTTTANRSNQQIFSFVASTETSANGIGYCKLSENDKFNFFSNRNITSSNIGNFFDYSTSSGATFTSGISSLTFEATATNAIGTGSRIQIYRLDAEKVADITVTSNTTQVDISNLSIDKDSEYLLVSDVENNDTSAGMVINLVPNDLTTLTGYHAQRIIGDGSSATSERRNDALMASVLPLERVLSHTHIKLSNIGAYTSQSYSIRQYGTSSVMVQNSFVSSTAENITSITKLNIISSVSNGIKAGSRFTLYKLYE